MRKEILENFILTGIREREGDSDGGVSGEKMDRIPGGLD